MTLKDQTGGLWQDPLSSANVLKFIQSHYHLKNSQYWRGYRSHLRYVKKIWYCYIFRIRCRNLYILRQVLKMEVIEASVTELPFPDNEFDLVCAFDVIEHVENDEQAMEEMKRVCKKEDM